MVEWVSHISHSLLFRIENYNSLFSYCFLMFSITPWVLILWQILCECLLLNLKGVNRFLVLVVYFFLFQNIHHLVFLKTENNTISTHYIIIYHSYRTIFYYPVLYCTVLYCLSLDPCSEIFYYCLNMGHTHPGQGNIIY